MALEAYLPAHLIPRTENRRKKNWRCVFPMCSEVPKTKHNCYAHVWDVHLRKTPGVAAEHPTLPLTTYKDSLQKDLLQRLCAPFMQKLVSKPTGHQEFPFAFTTDAPTLLQHLLASPPPSVTASPPAAVQSPVAAPPSPQQPTPTVATPTDLSDDSRDPADIISIRQIHAGLKQLHVLGEMLAEWCDEVTFE